MASPSIEEGLVAQVLNRRCVMQTGHGLVRDRLGYVSAGRKDHMTTKTSRGAAGAKLAATRADAAKRRQLADRVRSRNIKAELEAADRVRSTGWARA
jgi:hypothetical protein